MTTRVEAEEIEVTRSEKLLAFVLAVFILVGGVWAYFEIDDIGKPEPFGLYRVTPSIPEEDRQAIDVHQDARAELRRAEETRESALGDLEVRREAYRTALEAGQPAGSLEIAYRNAQERFEAAGREIERAEREVSATEPAAQAAQQRIGEVQEEARQEANERQEAHDRQTVALRIGLILAMLGAGYWSLGPLRERRSRYVLAAFALIGAAAAVGLVLAVDYTSDYIDVTEIGPLVLSLSGIALTLIAFWALQRYLANRIPRRRVRRGECPFCGFPIRGNIHCEGCGRRVIADCATCHQPRRVGTEHCAQCGAS